MSPAQTRLFFGGFALVIAAVTINAMRQPPRSATIAVATTPLARSSTLPASTASPAAPTPVTPSPAVAKAEPPAPKTIVPKQPDAANTEITIAAVSEPVRTARLLPNAAMVGQIPLPHAVDSDADTIRSLQKELLALGYGPLVVNGAPVPLTRAAIMGYEHDNGLALTGEASAKILKRVRGETPRTTGDPEARKIRSLEAEQVVRTVQHSLTTLGHQPGRIDGRLGEETEKAIRAFEVEVGIPATGRVSAELFSHLARGVGAKSANR
jgi:peptidoglycan hydrolase-like protein with peptidoglycan-binding domain